MNILQHYNRLQENQKTVLEFLTLPVKERNEQQQQYLKRNKNFLEQLGLSSDKEVTVSQLNFKLDCYAKKKLRDQLLAA